MLPHAMHLPLGQKDIRGQAGIHTLTIWLQLVVTLAVTFNRHIKVRSTGYNTAILTKFSISPINIAIRTAWADFFTSMPWIPG